MYMGLESIGPRVWVQDGNSSSEASGDGVQAAEADLIPQGLLVALPDQLHCTLYIGTGMDVP